MTAETATLRRPPVFGGIGAEGDATERGFYDQTIFHHVEPGLMLIAGGYTADLQRKSPRAPIYNESRNGLSNRRGTIAMIRDPDAPHSATSEFFVNLDFGPCFAMRLLGPPIYFEVCQI